jgi:hypothetical protein
MVIQRALIHEIGLVMRRAAAVAPRVKWPLLLAQLRNFVV